MLKSSSYHLHLLTYLLCLFVRARARVCVFVCVCVCVCVYVCAAAPLRTRRSRLTESATCPLRNGSVYVQARGCLAAIHAVHT